ncbi:MAG: hypothetical protein BGO69_03685 [Bacteroidetes bacterium 46-16]|nr:MAG: hypothetical protein BGO69_03685 [Bacteroidetes bacterium 46-16]
MTKRFIELDEFKGLSLLEQLNILYKDGVHIGKRTVDGKAVILYQVNNFYAEVYYKVYRKDVAKLLLSDNVEVVQPYLDQIQVKDLDESHE